LGEELHLRTVWELLMRRLTKTVLAAASAAALAVGMASPAMASNEIRVTIDPLDWEWEGVVAIKNFEGEEENNYTIDHPFSVTPGGGPQRVATAQMPSLYSIHKYNGFYLTLNGTVTNPHTGEKSVLGEYQVSIDQPREGWGELKAIWMYKPEEPQVVDVKRNLNKLPDPTTGENYYEQKFFLANEAPIANAAALMNLHETQSEGVEPDDCTVAATLSPGDTLTGTDGDDTVCVTVEGNGDSDAPITVDTGDGSDTVLIEGDTDATVVVDAGAGDDVVVADTDADVVVDADDGADAVNGGANTTVANVGLQTAVLGAAKSLDDCPGRWVFGPMNLPVCAY